MRTDAGRPAAGLARLLAGIWFRSFEVEGADRVPASGPVLEVAGHRNGLVDGVVLLAAGTRPPRFLAKATLWRIVPLRPLLGLAGAVRLYRASDADGSQSEGARTEANRRALGEAAAVLTGGGIIGIFPEGVSHDGQRLVRLRSGAARLAAEAVGDGAAGLVVVPVGIVYDDKTHFRSRALVRFGEPLPVGPDVPDVAALTGAVADALTDAGADFDEGTEGARMLRLARIGAPAGAGGRPSLAATRALAGRLADAAAADPVVAERLGGLDREALAYAERLTALGLRDRDLVASREGAPQPARWIPAALPAAVGVAVHALPYAMLAVAGRLPPNRGMRSTVKLLGSFGLYPVVYAALGLVVGRRRGRTTGLAAALAAPACGWVALRGLEAAEDGAGARRAARLRRRGGLDDVDTTRDRLAAAVLAVAPPH